MTIKVQSHLTNEHTSLTEEGYSRYIHSNRRIRNFELNSPISSLFIDAFMNETVSQLDIKNIVSCFVFIFIYTQTSERD